MGGDTAQGGSRRPGGMVRGAGGPCGSTLVETTQCFERWPLQVEVLFRAKSGARTKKLKLPSGMNVSVAWAEKGSYRQEHFLAYLERWLEPWTAEREAAGDYRVLLMDVARSHVGDAVWELCFSRGYVPLLHYGCTTAVGQVNDTDCHGDFQRVYVELEQATFARQQLFDPGNINRTIQEVLDDVCATWRSLNHLRAVAGHQRNGLSVALDGSEDHLIAREARALWYEAEMPEHRARALAEVDGQVATGALKSMADWRLVVRHPPNPGVILHEGGELEGELEDGEKPWLEDAEVSAAKLEEDALTTVPDEEVASAVLQEAGPADAKEAVDEAVEAAVRLERLRRLRALSREARLPVAVHAATAQIQQLERGLVGGASEKRKVNNLLRRQLDRRAREEALQVRARREEAAKRRKKVAVLKQKLKKAKAAKEKKKKEAAALKKRIASLPKVFTLKDLSAEGKSGQKLRKDVLDRLMKGSPPLPLEDQVAWPAVRDKWATHMGKKWDKKAPIRFLEEVNKVLQALGTEYKGETMFKKDGVPGDPDAFAKFFKEMAAVGPKFETCIKL